MVAGRAPYTPDNLPDQSERLVDHGGGDAEMGAGANPASAGVNYLAFEPPALHQASAGFSAKVVISPDPTVDPAPVGELAPASFRMIGGKLPQMRAGW